MVKESEKKRSDYIEATELWERMWLLEPFDESAKTALDVEGAEEVATSDPYNIVLLVQRLVASEARFEVPYLTATEEDDQRSETMEDWLTAYWRRTGRQAHRNIFHDMTWLSSVRGRGVLQSLWVKDIMPKRLRDRRLPIMTRTLDPRNAAVVYGPWGPEYCYHTYDADRKYIESYYPDYEFPDDGHAHGPARSDKHQVIDFWYADNSVRYKGKIWHCVLVDNKFAKKPTATLYPDIPMVEWCADGAPVEDELLRSLSILHPLRDLWPAKCRLVSEMGTALLYYMYPIYKMLNPDNNAWKRPIEIRPGGWIEFVGKQDMVPVRGDPDVPMATATLNLIDAQIQQSTFPMVMFGEPTGAASGYAINQLATSARGRINNIRVNQETALETCNEQILGIVEVFGKKEGVVVSGKGLQSFDRSRPIQLDGKIIKGSYETEVSLIPEIPTDETQRITTWLQLVKEGVISMATFRDKILDVQMPRNEDLRVTVEQVMRMPELQQKKGLYALNKWMPEEDKDRFISGTPLEAVQQQEQAWLEQRKAEREAAKAAKRQMEEETDRAKAQEELLATGRVPDGWLMMPDGSLTREGTTSSPGGLVPSGTPSPAMTPSPMIGPGGPPSPGMPFAGGLSPMEAQNLGGPPSAQPPGLPGLPPEAAGQITPEMAGVAPPAPGNVPIGPPGMFQTLMGNPPSDEVMQRLLMARGQGGPPPIP